MWVAQWCPHSPAPGTHCSCLAELLTVGTPAASGQLQMPDGGTPACVRPAMALFDSSNHATGIPVWLSTWALATSPRPSSAYGSAPGRGHPCLVVAAPGAGGGRRACRPPSRTDMSPSIHRTFSGQPPSEGATGFFKRARGRQDRKFSEPGLHAAHKHPPRGFVNQRIVWYILCPLFNPKAAATHLQAAASPMKQAFKAFLGRSDAQQHGRGDWTGQQQQTEGQEPAEATSSRCASPACRPRPCCPHLARAEPHPTLAQAWGRPTRAAPGPSELLLPDLNGVDVGPCYGGHWAHLRPQLH
jgi:hypothetical protein